MLTTINPSTEEMICEVAKGGKEDVDLAVQAASNALKGEWGKYQPSERRNLLLKVADNVEKNKEELASIVSTDNGKPLT